jgi:hypothetical protein
MSKIYPQELGDEQIRLITFDKRSPDSLALEVKTSELETVKGNYDALSYTWGSPEKVATVVCNNVQLKITLSLQEALKHLFDARTELPRPLWIDAICLDQDNGSEKAKQVPLMYNIYSQAYRVIIWLGPASPNSDDVFKRIPVLLPQLAAWRERKEPGFPYPSDTFWVDLGELFCRDWFKRLWTLQESVLGMEVVVMCGNRWLGWDDLTRFIRLTEGGGCRVKINQKRNGIFTTADAIISVSHADKIRDLIATKEGPELLLSILNLTRFRLCHNPVDHVFAILGLLPREMREEIGKLQGMSQMELFATITRTYHLRKLGASVLSLACSGEPTKTKKPSWCPDWNSVLIYPRILSMIPSYTAGVSPWPINSSPITLGPNDSTISVQGFIIDTVKFVGDPWPNFPPGVMTAEGIRLLRAWEADASSVAFSTLNVPNNAESPPEAYLRTLTGNVTLNGIGGGEDFSEEYKSWRHLMYCMDDVCSEGPHDPNATVLTPKQQQKKERFEQALGQSCNGRRIFGMESGRIGMGPRDLAAEDLVCVVLTGRPLYVLRKSSVFKEVPDQDQNTSDFSLIGEAYVDGLMSGEAFDLYEGSLDNFCIV